MLSCTRFPDLVLSNSWWKLRVESCALRERGLAHGTWANKVSHLKAYISFTTVFGVQDFPVHLGVLLRFIALLGRGSHTAKSASNIIGSVKFFLLVCWSPLPQKCLSQSWWSRLSKVSRRSSPDLCTKSFLSQWPIC